MAPRSRQRGDRRPGGFAPAVGPLPGCRLRPLAPSGGGGGGRAPRRPQGRHRAPPLLPHRSACRERAAAISRGFSSVGFLFIFIVKELHPHPLTPIVLSGELDLVWQQGEKGEGIMKREKKDQGFLPTKLKLYIFCFF